MRTRINPARGRTPGRGEAERRRRIVVEAARLMAAEGVTDYHAAKRKALDRLGLPPARDLPSNEEIAAALSEHLALFHGRRLAQDVPRLRRLAVEAMRFLAPFAPRLVGPVLSGAVTPESEVQLHLTADTPEDVALFLDERSVPYEQGERRLRFGGDRCQSFPMYRFVADGVWMELCCLPPRMARETPLSPVDGRPMKRASLKEAEALIPST